MNERNFEQTISFSGGLFQPSVREELLPYLVVVEGDDRGRRLLIDEAVRTIGREASRDLVLDDSEVSRLHFQVRVENKRVVIEDWNSTNGTFIDGNRLTGSTVLDDGSLVQAGHHVLKLEHRTLREVEERETLERDLEKASRYVLSLLPEPILEGPITTDWVFQPCAKLGGDGLGYHKIGEDAFACYLIDVSGHGAGAAMHSVGVANLLRQRALPGVNFLEPADVLSALNRRFPMEDHAGMFFTMWFGVYNLKTRHLRFACAGHHPGYLIPADRGTLIPLVTKGVMIGAAPAVTYRTGEVAVTPGSRLYLFSDGVFEIVTADNRQWRLADMLPILLEPAVPAESARIYRAVTAAARPGPLDDDFSSLVVTFS